VGTILNDTKKALGVSVDDTSYDPDLIMHINSVLAIVNQLGIGPAEGVAITDATGEWSLIIDTDLRLNSVKTYVYLRVRLLFDPPATGYLVEAIKEQIREIEWRLSTQRESVAWIDPTPDPIGDEVYDGGEP
jgi:hypothetical protein